MPLEIATFPPLIISLDIAYTPNIFRHQYIGHPAVLLSLCVLYPEEF